MTTKQLKIIWKAKQPNTVRFPLLVRRVSGESMLPNLRSGQIIFGNKKFMKLRTGNVIVFKHDNIENIKRIVVAAEDTVEVRGDNSFLSTDSRSFGPIKRSTIIAKVWWPRT